MKSIFRTFNLLLLLLVLSVNSQKEENVDSYYLDSSGHICIDTVDTVQKVEYDSQIHCTVSPMTVCDDDDDFEASKNSVLGRRIGQQPLNDPSDDLIVEGNDPIATFQHRQQTNTKLAGKGKQVCHTMSVKECKTVNRPKQSKVKVRVCPDDLPQTVPTVNELLFGELDPRFRHHRERSRRKQQSFQQGDQTSECDSNGQRTVCKTKVKTECTTIELTHEVEEQYPNCKKEMVDKCNDDPDKFGNCKRVPAMRCKIETRTVIKTKPETKCERVPKETCKKQRCTHIPSKTLKGDDDSGCYIREQTINEIFPEEKCSYTPKRICHQVDEGPKKIPRGGKKRSLVGLDAVKRRKRSALPPNYSDVDLLALESNAIEKKEKREGRQSQFGGPTKKGKRRRVVVKRRRQKARPVVSRKILPTTPTPTKTSKLSSRANFNEQTPPTFSGADIFLSRRRQSITLDKDPKLAISQPKQPFAVATQTRSTANSNFFIPAAPSHTATGTLAATAATRNVDKKSIQNHAPRSIPDTQATLKHQQSVLKLQQLQQQLLHIQRQQQLQQRLQHQKIVDLESKLLRARQNKDAIDEGFPIPSPTPAPIQLTPSPILPTDNHRIDVEEDGSLKLSILIKESLKRTKPKPERKVDTPRKGSSKPKFASFPTRIPHTLGPIPATTPSTVHLRTTPRLTRRPSTKKRLGTPTPRAKIQQAIKAPEQQTLRSSFGGKGRNNLKRPGNSGHSNIKERKGKNCRELPKQNCQTLRVNPKPVWKNMTRKICRVPRTKADKKLLQQLLEREDDGEESLRSQRNAAKFHAVDGADHQSQSSNTRSSRARSQKSSRSGSSEDSSRKNTSSKRNNRRGRKFRNRKNGGSDDPPNFSPFLNFPKFRKEYLERHS